MKKFALAALAICAAVSVAQAGQQIVVNKTSAKEFAPINWISFNKRDTITLHSGLGNGNSYNVQIFVDNYSSGPYDLRAGIKIKNCGNVTRIYAGSMAICQLNDANPTISFSSDSDEQYTSATGSYQLG